MKTHHCESLFISARYRIPRENPIDVCVTAVIFWLTSAGKRKKHFSRGKILSPWSIFVTMHIVSITVTEVQLIIQVQFRYDCFQSYAQILKRVNTDQGTVYVLLSLIVLILLYVDIFKSEGSAWKKGPENKKESMLNHEAVRPICHIRFLLGSWRFFIWILSKGASGHPWL